MHFTVVLQGGETDHLVAGITYEPAPVVTVGSMRLNLHGDRPRLERTDVPTMLQAMLRDRPADAAPKQAIVVIHETGHGMADDLACLKAGLEDAGFAVGEAQFPVTADGGKAS